MDRLEISFGRLAAWLSRVLEPFDALLAQLDLWVRLRLESLGVPHHWHSLLIAAAWALVVVLVVRGLTGWLRPVAVLAVGLVLAKVYGVLPRP